MAAASNAARTSPTSNPYLKARSRRRTTGGGGVSMTKDTPLPSPPRSWRIGAFGVRSTSGHLHRGLGVGGRFPIRAQPLRGAPPARDPREDRQLGDDEPGGRAEGAVD